MRNRCFFLRFTFVPYKISIKPTRFASILKFEFIIIMFRPEKFSTRWSNLKDVINQILLLIPPRGTTFTRLPWSTEFQISRDPFTRCFLFGSGDSCQIFLSKIKTESNGIAASAASRFRRSWFRGFRSLTTFYGYRVVTFVNVFLRNKTVIWFFFYNISFRFHDLLIYIVNCIIFFRKRYGKCICDAWRHKSTSTPF